MGHMYPNAPGPYKRMAVRKRFYDIKLLLRMAAPIIVDGGAHRGATIHILRKKYPKSVIHAFEPNPESYRFIVDKFGKDNNIHVYKIALGSAYRKISFNVMKKSATSSMLSAEAILNKDKEQRVPQEIIDVKMLRLDSVMNRAPHLVKLDLQGYELEAMKGFGKLLKDIRVITVEVEFVPLYKDQPLFADIDMYLRANNFRLFNIYDLWTRINGQLTTGDAVYINNAFYKDTP